MTHKIGRGIDVEALTRVEGEGGLRVAIEEGRVVDLALQIYEPPRFFEAFLRGRDYTEPPDITARICGICPVAYQMSACAAIEDACGATPSAEIQALRRLLYCGEWIESHALHVYLLHAPDFLGYESAIELAKDHRGLVDRGLALKQAGNRIVEVIGGRAVHPVNVRIGGFWRAPTHADIERLRQEVEPALSAALATVEWVAGFDFPDVTTEPLLVATDDPRRYPVMGERVVSSAGLDIGVAAFTDHFREAHVQHSTALHGHATDGGHYLTGPLARYSLASAKLAPAAHAAAQAAGLGPTCRNPFQSIVVRSVEIVHACEVALHLIERYEPPEPAAVPVEPRAGTGHGVTEAPRGLLYHRYTLDETGTITDASIVPPTSQNQPTIEDDVRAVVEAHAELDDEALRTVTEQSIRNHDPCISCATHFLRMEVERR